MENRKEEGKKGEGNHWRSRKGRKEGKEEE